MTHDKREIARASGNRKFVICHNLSFLLGHLENTLSAVRTRRSAGVSPALSTVYISRWRLEARAPGRPRHLTNNIFMRLGAPRRMGDCWGRKMSLVPFKDLMKEAERGGYAVGYFESWNLESLQAVTDAA